MFYGYAILHSPARAFAERDFSSGLLGFREELPKRSCDAGVQSTIFFNNAVRGVSKQRVQDDRAISIGRCLFCR